MSEAANPNANPQAPVTPEAPALVPDSPEYRAAMIAKAEGQSGTPPAPVAPTDPVDPQKPVAPEVPLDPNAPAPKLTDAPADAPKDGDPPAEKKDPETPEVPAYDFKAKFEDGSFVTSFNAETLPEDLSAALGKAMGLSNEQVAAMHAQFREGQVALQTIATQKLYDAAGGQQGFNDLIAWGQKNLTPQQREYYDGQLNGPHAAEAIEFLTSKMNAGKDPNLVNLNGGTHTRVSAFRDQSEMMAAMADPRYQASEAYRQEVAGRLRVSKF
ncbi:hypothetical protein QCE62_00205 [Caballeronia sp. LZ033]|uniref:hypothetical protein n=1 Tax=Caballeronia sp. LZ033 TaxID=3038566 RepID=UPI0028557DE0|nr:hypothetical protein [Caballeronia sp. LZ033]MDR5812009.1 hypothetical protein [Caballeronia sp. LZ033]